MLASSQCMHTARRKGLVQLSYLALPIPTDPFYQISVSKAGCAFSAIKGQGEAPKQSPSPRSLSSNVNSPAAQSGAESCPPTTLPGKLGSKVRG